MLGLNEILKEKKLGEPLTLITFNNLGLKDVSVLSTLKNLQFIYLNNNLINTLSFCKNLTKLKELHMENNKLTNLKEINYLSDCHTLIILNLKGNPIEKKDNKYYKSMIKKIVTSIKIIDGINVNEKDNENDIIDKKNNVNFFEKLKKKIVFNNDINSNIDLTNKNKDSNVLNCNNIKMIIKRNPKFICDENNFGTKNTCRSEVNTLEIINEDSLKKAKDCKKKGTKENYPPKLNSSIENNNSSFAIKNNFFEYKEFSLPQCSPNKADNLQINSNTDNNNILGSVSLLLNELNLEQLNKIQNFINEKIGSKLIVNSK